MSPPIQFKVTILPVRVGVALACLFLSKAQAVNPPPDGGYPGFTTAEGTNALKNLSDGIGNTAAGWYSLFTNSSGSYNTGIGAGTLALNNADSNTAIGTAALLFNIAGSGNTAVGETALLNNDGSDNTAVGSEALSHNTQGSGNTGTGAFALISNTNGSNNVGNGYAVLSFNTEGHDNTAAGSGALFGNLTGNNNTAVGSGALADNDSGNSNIAVGFHAGGNLTTGSNNIDIGNVGIAGEQNTIRIGALGIQTATYIAGISGQTSSGGAAVFVNANGKLGTSTSSARFKDEIRPMDKASEVILALRPVSFRYKKEIDPQGIPQSGLVAEEVEEVNPDLVVRDEYGNPYSVRYDQINAMLLNEFLKEHRRNAKQEATIARQQKQIEALAAGLQKVRHQLELSKTPPQVANNP
jgi:hypothetical protein